MNTQEPGDPGLAWPGLGSPGGERTGVSAGGAQNRIDRIYRVEAVLTLKLIDCPKKPAATAILVLVLVL